MIHTLAALDLGLGVSRGGFVGRLLGDQSLLEDLKRVRHRSDFGLFALMRDVGGQVAVTQRFHRGDD